MLLVRDAFRSRLMVVNDELWQFSPMRIAAAADELVFYWRRDVDFDAIKLRDSLLGRVRFCLSLRSSLLMAIVVVVERRELKTETV